MSKKKDVFFSLNLDKGPQRWFFDEMAFLGAQQFESKDAERAQTLVSG